MSMPASKSDIRNWIERAKKENARWLIVACDDFDHSDYPICFKETEINECLKKISDIKTGNNMQRLMEVYDLKKPIEDQLNSRRAMEIPTSSVIKSVEKDIIKSKLNDLKISLDSLTSEQRLEIFSNYCKHCGTKDPKCTCMRDE